MDFLKALGLGNEKATIVFGGESYEISRQRLGGHYALESTISKLREWMGIGLYDTVDCYIEWMAYATGFSEKWLNRQDPIEFADAFAILVTLNEPRATLPWMTIQTKRAKVSIDYPNRNLAAIVNRIAESHHWTESDILSLVPEVAWCYIQEILLSEHERREFAYGLSEVAYDKKGQYKDFQKPPWYHKVEGSTTIPDLIRPTGNVVDLTRRSENAS